MRILCIGDSNTWGYNPDNGQRLEGRWTKVLAQMMPEHEIIEEGLNGRTLCSPDPVKPERCGIAALKLLLMSHKPLDLVILMLGTNELKSCYNCSASRIASDIERFVNVIWNPVMWGNFNIPRLLVVSPVLLRDQIAYRDVFGEFGVESVIQSKLLADEISKVCLKMGVDFMNAADFAESSLVDNVHMDEENHKKLALALADRITNLKDMLVVLKNARNNRTFANKDEFSKTLMQMQSVDNGLNFDWDESAGEEWAWFYNSELGKVCLINSVMRLAFFRTGYDLQAIRQVLADFEIVTVNDFHTSEWFIDLDALKEEIWEISWRTSDGIVDHRRFSLDDFYYATV